MSDLPPDVHRLEWRVRIEIGLTNLVGIGVLIVALYLFEPPAAEALEDVSWPSAVAAMVPVYVLGVVVSLRLRRPLVEWLASGEPPPAPEALQRRVVAHPAAQAAVLLVLWASMALVLAAAHLTRSPEEPVRAFLTSAGGVLVAGIIVSTLSFLADQRLLGPWYPRFFGDEDPTRFGVPSSKVRRRVLLSFVLGGAVPLILVGFAVSERVLAPEGTHRLGEIVWFLAAVGIASGLFLALSVRHSIVRPLELIRRAAERVRAGDLSASVPVESADELGELSVAFNAMVEGLRERRHLEDIFGRQVGAAVAARALEAGMALGGERRVISALVLDLAGFTGFTEEAPPESVVDVLNRVFAVVIREVDSRGGLVNKFTGDGVLAVFGAPLDDADHAAHAVDAARAICAELDAEGFEFGIGVATGPVVAGNVGSEERFEYTVVGDAVNQAARLQDLTRERDCRVLVAGSTVAWMGGADGLEPAGSAVLRGRSLPTELFALP